MNKKLLVLDIDGTLTNSKKEITDVTKKAIEDMMARGHSCMLASGRPTPGMEAMAKALDFDKFGGYLLSFNGAKIVKFDTKEVVHQLILDHKYLQPLYQFACDNGLGILTYGDGEILSGNIIDKYVDVESRINNLPVVAIDNFPTAIDFPVNKCLMTADPERAEVLVKTLQDMYKGELSIYRSEPFFIEIMPLNVDKATSLQVIIDKLGFNQADCICCGDGYNDVSMINFAGVGVAMANACDEAKKVANYITLSNDEDGLIPVIEKFCK